MKTAVKHIWHTGREYFTHWMVAGVILAATGAAPEHWLADLFKEANVPLELLHFGTAEIDFRLVVTSLGAGLIVIDVVSRLLRDRAVARAMPIPTSAILKPKLSLPDRPSLVVLPFENMTGDAEQDYFSDGIVEDITTALARIPSLFVIARNSAFTYKGHAVDVRQVGRDLGIRYVLEGSVRKSGDRLRITAQLVEAETGAHLWADHFDGALEEVFGLQDRITSAVAGIVEPRLQRAEIELAQRKPTKDLGAYDYYMRGIAILNKSDPKVMLEAQAMFAKATGIDKDYAAAYGLSALCAVFRRANYNFSADSDSENVEGIRLARLAAATGRHDPTAMWSAGYALAFLNYDLDGGMRLIERGCELNPNSAMAWNRAGYVRNYLGDYTIALENFERAIRLSPVDPLLHLSHYGVAMTLIFERRYEEALAWADRAVSEQPNYVSSFRLKAIALALAGQVDAARRVMAALLQAEPQMRLADTKLHVYRLCRQRKDAERWVEGLRLSGMPE